MCLHVSSTMRLQLSAVSDQPSPPEDVDVLPDARAPLPCSSSEGGSPSDIATSLLNASSSLSMSCKFFVFVFIMMYVSYL